MNTHLMKLRKWLEIPDAATYLSQQMETAVSSADVLSFALDGHVPLSLFLPVGTEATAYMRGPDGEAFKGPTKIDGLWTILLEGPGRRQVEHTYHYTKNQHFISVEGIGAASVISGTYRFTLEPTRSRSGFSPRSSSAFPEDSVLGITVSALDAFVATHKPQSGAETLNQEKPLDERERETLSLIVAALAADAPLDLTQPYKAAEAVVSQIEALGYKRSSGAIANHLARIAKQFRSDREKRRGMRSL